MKPDPKTHATIVGRGVASNPSNRFERVQVSFDSLDDYFEPQDLKTDTQYFNDKSRSIIAHNDSPDIGYSVSINPYRGCSHGCAYCLSGDTLILMGDGTTKPLRDIRVGDEIYGTVREGAYRRYRRTRVLAHWQTQKPAYNVRLENGTELVASGDHRFLSEGGWKYVAPSDGRRAMKVGDRLVGSISQMIEEDQVIEANEELGVSQIVSLGDLVPMYDITTGTEDFIANGVISHNCYARPTHEYLGFSAGLDFESKIMVKLDAPQLLRKELSKASWKPQMVGFSGVTDIYQPAERQLELARRCLEVFLDFRNPVAMITKNYMITRDLDLLKEMAQFDCVSAAISITTLDDELRRVMEPRTSAPSRRLKAVEMLANAGIPVGVMTAPIIPGLTDHEIPRLVQAAADAGAQWVGYNIVHLPYGVKELFVDWLERHFPERKNKVVGRIKELRGGQLNDPRFGYRMSGEGVFAEQIAQLHRSACKKAGLPKPRRKLSTEHFRVPGRAVQVPLFE